MFGDEIPRVGDWWKVANESINMNKPILGVIPQREMRFAAKGPSSAHPVLICYINTIESGPVVNTVPRTRHPHGRFGWQHSRHAACLTSCALDDKATVCPTVYGVALVDFEPDGVTVFSCTEPLSSHIMRNLRDLGFIEE